MKRILLAAFAAIMMVMTGCQKANASGDLLIPKTDTEIRQDMKVKKLTIVDFNATWCGPCRYLAPSFEKAAKAYAGKVDFYSVDVDQFGETARAFNVQAIPTLYIKATDGTTRTIIGLNDFLQGLDENTEPTEQQINDTIYSNLCKIIDSYLK